jgi:polyferredoxin
MKQRGTTGLSSVGKNISLSSIITVSILILIAIVLLSTAIGAEETAVKKSPGFFAYWTLPRVWMAALVGLIGLVLLMRAKVSQTVRLISQVVIFILFSVVTLLPLGSFAKGMGLHPSPLCTIEKPFLFIQAGRSVPIMFWSLLIFIGLMTIVGNKLFCGWNCPIGALQEILHRIPLSRKLKIKLPFKVTNFIRTVVFIVFVGLVFSIGLSIYEYVNPFEFLHWTLTAAVLPAFLLTFLAALFIYRPFCYLICPLGLYTWLLEHLSVVRIKLNKAACTHCNICVVKSPCPAVPAILAEKRIRPDCHACGRCIEICPEKALEFRL